MSPFEPIPGISCNRFEPERRKFEADASDRFEPVRADSENPLRNENDIMFILNTS